MDWLPAEAAFVVGGIVLAAILYLVISERWDRKRDGKGPPDKDDDARNSQDPPGG